jgi:hypothetical protein
VDVCRQSVVFEDLGGIAACLRAMREDDQAEVSEPSARENTMSDCVRGGVGGFVFRHICVRLSKLPATFSPPQVVRVKNRMGPDHDPSHS